MNQTNCVYVSFIVLSYTVNEKGQVLINEINEINTINETNETRTTPRLGRNGLWFPVG